MSAEFVKVVRYYVLLNFLYFLRSVLLKLFQNRASCKIVCCSTIKNRKTNLIGLAAAELERLQILLTSEADVAMYFRNVFQQLSIVALGQSFMIDKNKSLNIHKIRKAINTCEKLKCPSFLVGIANEIILLKKSINLYESKIVESESSAEIIRFMEETLSKSKYLSYLADDKCTVALFRYWRCRTSTLSTRSTREDPSHWRLQVIDNTSTSYIRTLSKRSVLMASEHMTSYSCSLMMFIVLILLIMSNYRSLYVPFRALTLLHTDQIAHTASSTVLAYSPKQTTWVNLQGIPVDAVGSYPTQLPPVDDADTASHNSTSSLLDFRLLLAATGYTNTVASSVERTIDAAGSTYSSFSVSEITDNLPVNSSSCALSHWPPASIVPTLRNITATPTSTVDAGGDLGYTSTVDAGGDLGYSSLGALSHTGKVLRRIKIFVLGIAQFWIRGWHRLLSIVLR